MQSPFPAKTAAGGGESESQLYARAGGDLRLLPLAVSALSRRRTFSTMVDELLGLQALSLAATCLRRACYDKLWGTGVALRT